MTRSCDITEPLVQPYLHDGNPLDWENQVRNAAGILEKIGIGLLSYRIIIVDFKSIGNRISQTIFDASFYRDVGDNHSDAIKKTAGAMHLSSPVMSTSQGGHHRCQLREIG